MFDEFIDWMLTSAYPEAVDDIILAAQLHMEKINRAIVSRGAKMVAEDKAVKYFLERIEET